MARRLRFLFSIVMSVSFAPLPVISQGDPGFTGKWTLVQQKSTEIDLYGTLNLAIQQDAATVTIIQTWGIGRSFTDTLTLKTGGVINLIPVRNRVWPTDVFMGISMQTQVTQEVTARWEKSGKLLRVERLYNILASQGRKRITSVDTYELSDDKETITLKISRSTRKTGPGLLYVLKRSGGRQAYFMKIEDGWEIGGKLPQQALLLSLQGVANVSGPRLYFLYPEDWPFTYTRSVFDFYKNHLNYTFDELRTPEEALEKLKDHIKGYVVWDKSVRTSLIVAFTVAGLERSVVVSEEMIPLVERAGLKAVADFRGKFIGLMDAEIYKWAYDQYWNRCSKEFVVWVGGESGKVMKPAVSDFGILKQAFFTDLSTKPEDAEEYALSKKIFGEMKTLSLVMGWHSYAKDKERDYVKLASNYGLRVIGLHTLPNVSFSCRVPTSNGFKFSNNHNLVPGKSYLPEKKVYISCIQTDGIGLGAWLRPGRGEIPYAWEVEMNWIWLAPSMLEYFRTTATPNDFFIGCLSGPGYMYPKAIPPKFLPEVIAKAWDLMRQLDLNVFEIMDYSEGATVEGNTELTKQVVDAYYKGMPDVVGFVNGYAPAYTFTVRDGKPLISYDYYLSPTRPEADAVADLQELASVNNTRPYFLLMHVRESSDIKRVKGVLDKLGPEFELVPLDVFLRMAGTRPTFHERFLER